MKLKSIGVTTLLLFSLALTGCSNNNPSTKTETSKGSNNAIEQKITISVPTELVTLDTTQTTDKNTFTIVQHLFEGLYRLDKDSIPIPGIAEEAKISEDGLTYSFKIKPAAKWSNGEKITAHDFVYSWKKLVNPESGAQNAYLLDNVKNSKEIRVGDKSIDELGISAPSDDEFKVELIQPQHSFLTLISIAWLAPQNQKYVESQGDKYASDGDHLIFNGPFVITDWTQGSDSFTLKKNKAYYDNKNVHLEEIKGSTIKEENTGVDLFNGKDLDITKLSSQLVAQYTDNEALISNQDISNFFLDFNQKEGTPLANLHLRKAIAYGINKEPLSASILNDGAQPLYGLVPKKLFTNQETGEEYRKYSGDYMKYDLKKAQKEWKEAQKEVGKKVELSLLVSDDDNGKKIAEYVQSQIQENLPGISIKIQAQPKNNVNQSRIDKDYELSLSAWNAGDNNLGMFFILYESNSAYNYGSYSNLTYDDLALAAKTTDANDLEKQFADYKKAEKILLEDDVAQVPLYQSASNYLINPNLKNVRYPLYGGYFFLRDAQLK